LNSKENFKIILFRNFMAKKVEIWQQWYTAPQHLPTLLVKYLDFNPLFIIVKITISFCFYLSE
jgi:hypothetical protein